ncbi:hypothetical protein SSX86_026058 [Deinandra increscens subsp. villosa]|uniref:Root phototropism protein 2 n=1 Tax=Deinandra increscens subsp. villosa TaxID=3103831 RepID=A0AAP0CDT2_9ASTR
MATHVKNTQRFALPMHTTELGEDIPTDIQVQVGKATFPLHKIMLVAKSNYIRKLIVESEEPDLGTIDLSNIPGGAKIFGILAKFCYGVNIEITVNNVAALHCAAEYLQMTDEYFEHNLVNLTHGFLTQVALTSLSGAITVLNSCEDLLPVAQELNIFNQCVDVVSAKKFIRPLIIYFKFLSLLQACEEADFPSCLPPNWWAEELSKVNITFFPIIIDSMKSRGAKSLAIACAITTYANRSLPEILFNRSANGVKSPASDDSSTSRNKQREILDSIVALLPVETRQSGFPINFLCRLLRVANFLQNDGDCKRKLEKRISAVLEHATVDDLLILSFRFDGERLRNTESVRRIVTGFVEKKSRSVINYADFNQAPSPTVVRVAKTVDAYLHEIASDAELSISQFIGIANLMPRNVREVDDDLYRAIDIYLQAHPHMDEIEREKACNAMDPLKLSVEARMHASQNKRLPLHILLPTLCFDQLHERSGQSTPSAQSMRLQVNADVRLVKENEKLRNELLRMKMYVSDIEKNHHHKVGSSKIKKPTFFSSVSKTLGKLNPFRQGSKDTTAIDDREDRGKPRRRRFSMS